MNPPDDDDDAFRMTVLALRYPTSDRRLRTLDRTRRLFERAARGDRVSTTIQQERTTKLEEIRARIERDAYTVDAPKVADALVERLLDGRSVKGTGRR
jgi:anti-sigma28 factor (negative regulator of flagellin synthesis)